MSQLDETKGTDMHEIRRKCYEGRPRKSEQFLSEAFEVDLVSVEANWSTKRSAVTRDATLCFCKFPVPFYLFQKIMLGQDGASRFSCEIMGLPRFGDEIGNVAQRVQRTLLIPCWFWAIQ
jgi:hypothetical protein